MKTSIFTPYTITQDLLVGIFTVLIIISSGCRSDKEKSLDIDAVIDYIPIQTEKSGRWGLMNVNARLLFENEFIDEPTLAISGLLSVHEGAGLSIYHAYEQPVLLGDCEGLANIGFCNEGMIPVVRENSRISVISNNGAEVFTLMPIDGKEIMSAAKCYNNNRLVAVNEDDMYGAYDMEGNMVIPMKYSYLSNFNEGFAIAKKAEKGTYVIIDTEGQIACDVQAGYTIVSPTVKRHSVVIADSAKQLNMMDIRGNIMRLPRKVKSVGDYNENYLTFSTAEGYWGLMSRKDLKVMIRPKYTTLYIVEDGKLLANLDERWSVIDLNGKTKFIFDEGVRSVIHLATNGNIKYMAQDNAGWLIYDANGKEIPTEFNIYDFGSDASLEQGKLTSQYFNEDELVKTLLAMVTPNSLAGIQLNALANHYYADQSPDDFDERSEFSPTKQPEKGIGYSLNVIGVTERAISTLKYNYKTDSYDTIFTPNNTIYAIEVDANTAMNNIFDRSKEALIKGLQDMGFVLIEQDDETVTLRSHYANIEISSLESDNGLSILMYKL